MREKIYHWTLSARIQHWLRAVTITVLILTGLYMHAPFFSSRAGSIMGTIRFIHFVFADILLIGLILRIYSAFRRTIIGDWKDLGPVRNLRQVPDILKYYLFLKKSHKPYPRYNPLQALAYLFLGGLIVLQGLTGFAIYSGAPGLSDAFAWVNRLLGGETYTRLLHYFCTWIFIIFIPIHVYLVILQTAVEKDSSLSSIFTGFKTKIT